MERIYIIEGIYEEMDLIIRMPAGKECQGWGLPDSPTTCDKQYYGLAERATWANGNPTGNCSQKVGGKEAQGPYEG